MLMLQLDKNSDQVKKEKKPPVILMITVLISYKIASRKFDAEYH